jgi:hypothetical protein
MRSQVVKMCKTKASTSAKIPVVLVAAVLVSGAVSTAAAAIASIAFTVLTVLGVLAAVGIASFVVVLRRDRAGLWRPAPARLAVRPPALPSLQPAVAIAKPVLLAIEPPELRAGDADLAGALIDATAEPELVPARA